MKKHISRILLLLFAELVFMSAKTASATHLVGGYITYTYISGNTYLVELHVFYDCIPASVQDSMPLCIRSASLNYDTLLVMHYYISSVFAYHPCLGPVTSCLLGGPTWGISDNVFTGIVTLPAVAPDWIFSVYICCRNWVPNTIDGSSPGVVPVYTFSMLDNLNVPYNNSPQFNYNLMPVFCLNVLTTYNFSCVDPDGDSLVYRLDSTYIRFNCDADTAMYPMVYFPPYSYSNFLTSSTPIAMDSSSGALTFTPSLIQGSIYSVTVDEYRNGIKIGSMKRQEEILITPGANTVSSTDHHHYNLSVFPNPVNDILIAATELQHAGQLKIKITDITGRAMEYFTEQAEEGSWRKEIRVAGLAAGIYFLQIEAGLVNVETRMFVKL